MSLNMVTQYTPSELCFRADLSHIRISCLEEVSTVRYSHHDISVLPTALQKKVVYGWFVSREQVEPFLNDIYT